MYRDPGDQPRKPKHRPAAAGTRNLWRPDQVEAPAETHAEPDAWKTDLHFRHSHWQHRRDRLRGHLERTGSTQKQLDAWDSCGTMCRVQRSESRDTYRLNANYCKNRHCQPCARARANLIARNLFDRLTGELAARRRHAGKRVRFITLTMKHSSDPLQKQIGRLVASFKKMRSCKLWKRRQEGGAAIVEVKWTGREWHPHLHIVAEGDFMHKEELRDLWHKTTGDSIIVDIRRIDRERDVCHYVCKYITKGVNDDVWENDDAAQEWICAARSLRPCNTFGTWRGWALMKRVPGVNDWVHVSTLSTLIMKARSGDLAAQAIMLQLRPPGTTDEVTIIERKPP